MNTPNIYNLLQECKVESDVEEKYKRIISGYFPDAKISSPYYTDGLLENENGLKMLMEFKFNFDLTKRLQLVDLLIQLIYYLKNFEDHGDELPTIVFGGDSDECFCLHSNDLIPYLNEDLDWSIAPSTAPSKNPVLAKKLYNDQNIKPYIFSINNNRFDFKFVVDKIKQLHNGSVQKLHITELNINRFFSYFEGKIIKQKKKYDSETLVSIFLGCLIDSNNYYSHPKKKNLLVTPTGDVSINRSIFDSFLEHFETNYLIEEKKKLTAICDRLIKDDARRFRGEFFTPTEWVLEAHKMIEEQFGLDWKEEYVVWDPAWGTGNLTRDFKFKELYCSTINYGDLEIGKHYNPEAVKFQYDFLNDDVTPEGILPIDKIKLPEGLLRAFEKNKKIIIFMNPPYLKSSIYNKHVSKDTNYIIEEKMKYDGLGNISKQLYSAFLYRSLKFPSSNINICTFTPSTFITTVRYDIFRKIFFKRVKFDTGFIFNLKYFHGTTGDDSVLFSIWKSGEEKGNEFNVLVKDVNENRIITTYDRKKLYFLKEDELCKNWGKPKIEKDKFLFPCFSSGLKIKPNKQHYIEKDFIGFIEVTRKLYDSCDVVILTAPFSTPRGYSINESNFYKCISIFTSQKSVLVNWINKKDEFKFPNEQHLKYSQWNTDAIIYSLFNGASNQSSLRKITCKDKIWDIKNEWFWMANEQMLQLANENGFDELYHDATGDHDRFVFNKIKESSFTEDAQEVLDKAIELVIKTFPYREQLHEEHPEWHLNTWDAGWYQIKLILKKYFKDDLKEFNLLYKKFEDRMREGVYKFGFLKE